MAKNEWSIGEVVEMLKPEYPEISAFAVRFWEKKGLLHPAKHKEGTHRRYNRNDLALIQLIKDLSRLGYSLAQIKKDLEEAKRKMGTSEEGQIPHRFFQQPYFARILQRQRMINALNIKLKDLRTRLLDGIYGPLYDQKTLNRVLEFGVERSLLERVEKVGLIQPQEEEGTKMYSFCDELILRILILVSCDEEDFVENCKSLNAAIRYLSKDVGIGLQFPADPEKNPTIPTYKAVLYNLISQRQKFYGEQEQNWGVKEAKNYEN